MFNLLRSDLYRITRRRGELVGYACLDALFVVVPTVIGVLTLYLFPQVGEVTLTGIWGGPSLFAGGIYLGSSLLPLLGCLGTVQIAFSDLTGGFAKNLASAVRGRLALAAERVVLAGVFCLALLAVSLVTSLAFAVVGSAVAGEMIILPESVGGFLLWLADTWLAMWALAAASLALAQAIRTKPASYLGALAFVFGIVPAALAGAGALLSGTGLGEGLLRAAGALQGSLAPSAMLRILENGSAAALGPGTLGPFGFVGGMGAQMALVSLVWIALAAATAIAAARVRDV